MFPLIQLHLQIFIHSIHFTLDTFYREKRPDGDEFNVNAPSESQFYPCFFVMDSCEERCQGSARQPYTQHANTWHHLGSARPRNISPLPMSLSLHPLSPQNEDFFFLNLRMPCPQQGSNSLKKGAPRLCWIKQTNKQTKVGSLCMYAGFTQDASERGENVNLFFLFF